MEPGGAMEPTRRQEILSFAAQRALGCGVPGALAMGCQVVSFMWLRTITNKQARDGGRLLDTARLLYAEGGLPRFYRGVGIALVQAPLVRFGETACNAGMVALLTGDGRAGERPACPLWAATLAGSTAAGLFRMALMPLEVAKTMMQVEGRRGSAALASKVRRHGLGVLYHGSLAASGATLCAHFPWFLTFNYLDALLPQPGGRGPAQPQQGGPGVGGGAAAASGQEAGQRRPQAHQEQHQDPQQQQQQACAPPGPLHLRLLRSAGIGFAASVVSDVVANAMRVLKTAKQASRSAVTYRGVYQDIVRQDGLVRGLLGRGLQARLLANALQGVTFTVLWRLGQDYWATAFPVHVPSRWGAGEEARPAPARQDGDQGCAQPVPGAAAAAAAAPEVAVSHAHTQGPHHHHHHHFQHLHRRHSSHSYSADSGTGGGADSGAGMPAPAT